MFFSVYYFPIGCILLVREQSDKIIPFQKYLVAMILTKLPKIHVMVTVSHALDDYIGLLSKCLHIFCSHFRSIISLEKRSHLGLNPVWERVSCHHPKWGSICH